ARESPGRSNDMRRNVLAILTIILLVPSVVVARTATFGSNWATAAPTTYNEFTVAQLQAEMAGGRLTSVQLTQFYLDRIAALDQAGPNVNSVIELNPDALKLARSADNRRPQRLRLELRIGRGRGGELRGDLRRYRDRREHRVPGERQRCRRPQADGGRDEPGGCRPDLAHPGLHRFARTDRRRCGRAPERPREPHTGPARCRHFRRPARMAGHGENAAGPPH